MERERGMTLSLFQSAILWYYGKKESLKRVDYYAGTLSQYN
jgi:hypothetical protein